MVILKGKYLVFTHFYAILKMWLVAKSQQFCSFLDEASPFFPAISFFYFFLEEQQEGNASKKGRTTTLGKEKLLQCKCFFLISLSSTVYSDWHILFLQLFNNICLQDPFVLFNIEWLFKILKRASYLIDLSENHCCLLCQINCSFSSDMTEIVC